MISNRVNNIKPSLTIATNMKAQELKRTGKDIIVLAAGEPDFDTPEHIKSAAIEAINNGFTKYTQVDGIDDLKSAIVNKFKLENKINYLSKNITVGAGGSGGAMSNTAAVAGSTSISSTIPSAAGGRGAKQATHTATSGGSGGGGSTSTG